MMVPQVHGPLFGRRGAGSAVEIIRADGRTIRTKTGIKAHPAVRDEIALR